MISQVLYDPESGVPDPGGEWIVLWNPSNKTVQIVGWKLRDTQGDEELPAIELPAGATVLVTAVEAGGSVLPPATLRVTLPGHIANGLRNAGDSLALLDSSGQLVDALSWGDDRSVFNPPVPVTRAGQPLIRNGATDSDSASDWMVLAAPTATAVPLIPAPATNTPPAVAPDQSRKAGLPATPTTKAGAAEPLALQSPAASRVVLSEIAPHEGWVEIYNYGSESVDLKHWSLADGTGVATVMLSEVVLVPPNGFVVVQASALNLTQPDSSIALRDPAGTVVDIVTLAPVKANRSLSRFPVHGGGWVIDTPLTAGQFNQPAPEPTLPLTPTPKQIEATTMLAADIQPGIFKPWMLAILAVFTAGLGLLLMLLRRQRP